MVYLKSVSSIERDVRKKGYLITFAVRPYQEDERTDTKITFSSDGLEFYLYRFVPDSRLDVPPQPHKETLSNYMFTLKGEGVDTMLSTYGEEGFMVCDKDLEFQIEYSLHRWWAYRKEHNIDITQPIQLVRNVV